MRKIPGVMIKRFGGVGKNLPLVPNALRDRELVNPPHPKILGLSKVLFLFFRIA